MKCVAGAASGHFRIVQYTKPGQCLM